MAGMPGYPWQPYPPPPSTQEGESQRAQLEATLRMLREQRPQIAAEIGEYLYSLVLQGQMRDPVVLATCRRLYDYEQQVLQLEANLRALPVAPSANQAPAYVPPVPVNPSTGPSPGSRDNAATVVAPAGRSSHDAPALGDSDATRVAPPGSREGGRVGTGSHDASPAALAPDRDAAETMIAPVRRPEPVAPGGGKTTERRCGHCRMPLRANDTTCPVCGRPAGEQPAQAAQCRRCGTDLRAQDHSCPVCGTPRA